MENYKMFIGGEWVDALSGETFDDFNPYTGELYAKVSKGDARDADRAMAAAFAARREWAGTPPIARAQILNKAAQILEVCPAVAELCAVDRDASRLAAENRAASMISLARM